jgi:monooxygenase
VQPQPLLGLKSGYVRRGIDHFPKQGTKAPWVFRQNYFYDVLAMRLGALNDGTLVFSKGASVALPDPGMAIDAIDAERAATST